ncbi:MAG TPA: nickel transporter [Steroidobacter sp.]|uniref:HoxN/HupN/NixA family nickel/cobalt transporter n=1 Tax=Steroidobacter sp. TaxID=1978227 RepID=UPI002ED80E1C
MTQSWSNILLLAFVFGLRHGFDADHLTTIQGMTRLHLHRRPKLADWCGALFSAGHGTVVMVVAFAASLLAHQWKVPGWLSLSGALISIGSLLFLGLLNVHSVFSARADETVALRGLKGHWLGGLARAGHPLVIAGIGMLFALSFDTVSLAALFALTAQRFDGAFDALILGAAFTMGMWAADGLNGLWIARLLRRADATALLVSRILGLSLGGLSLVVAGFGIAKIISPVVDEWSDGRELAVGLATLILPIAVFVFAIRTVDSQSDSTAKSTGS